VLAAQQGYDKTRKVLFDAVSKRAAQNSAQKRALLLACETPAANGDPSSANVTGDPVYLEK
jgi:hypothetical protein